jgi:hypothetical protein
MKRILIGLVGIAMSIHAMNPPQGPEVRLQNNQEQAQDEWSEAALECCRALRQLWQVAANASNPLVKKAWDFHHDRYLAQFNQIEPQNKKQKVPILDVQIKYFLLKHKIENRIAQNPVDMLARTYWKGAVVAISATTAVAVPLTYAASREIYRRWQGDEEDFGDGLEEEKNPEGVCVDECPGEIPDLMQE